MQKWEQYDRFRLELRFHMTEDINLDFSLLLTSYATRNAYIKANTIETVMEVLLYAIAAIRGIEYGGF